MRDQTLLVWVDTVAAINEKHKLIQKQQQEIEETERHSDREVSGLHSSSNPRQISCCDITESLLKFSFLTASPHYCHRKCIETRNENFNFDFTG